MNGLLKLGRAGLAIVALASVVQWASADAPAGGSPCRLVSVEVLLAAPGRYAEQAVRIREQVLAKTRAIFPNGRPYYTLLVGSGQRTLTVFSWADPGVERGDRVDVLGVFHVWRYNLHHMVESHRITRVEPPASPGPPGCEERVPG